MQLPPDSAGRLALSFEPAQLTSGQNYALLGTVCAAAIGSHQGWNP